jgi:hypothetical protein
MYMYIFIYMYIYTYIYIRIYKYFIYMYIYMYLYICLLLTDGEHPNERGAGLEAKIMANVLLDFFQNRSQINLVPK